MPEGEIKSPFWVYPSKAELIRHLDSVFDPERYTDIEQYRDVLIATARKNPKEFQFYLETMIIKVEMIHQIIIDASKDDIKADA